MVTLTQLKAQRKTLDLLQQRIDLIIPYDILYSQIREIDKQVAAICPHLDVRTTNKYSEGGYDYVSSVTIYEHCSTCNALLNMYDDKSHRGYHA
jgi:hypothetical protein